MTDTFTVNDYQSTTEALVKRISVLIPAHPEIMDMEPFDLFKVDGFDCSDLQPSLAQASWALAKAKADHEQ